MSSTLPLSRNWGDAEESVDRSLLYQLDDMYFDIASALTFLIKKNILTGVDPQPTEQLNSLFSIGDLTIRTDTNRAWIMTSRTTDESVTWTLIT